MQKYPITIYMCKVFFRQGRDEKMQAEKKRRKCYVNSSVPGRLIYSG